MIDVKSTLRHDTTRDVVILPPPSFEEQNHDDKMDQIRKKGVLYYIKTSASFSCHKAFRVHRPAQKFTYVSPNHPHIHTTPPHGPTNRKKNMRSDTGNRTRALSALGSELL
jgi:hypothetical protein